MSGLATEITGDLEDWIADALPPVSPTGDGHQPTVRVGIDLTSVAEVAASVARFGDRYVERMFTFHEQAYCRRETGPEEPGHYRTESLAARFAAKEAVLKVLRPLGPRPPWRDIEVYRAAGGWCEVRLSGSAATLAARAGIDRWSVSQVWTKPAAGTTAVAQCWGAGGAGGGIGGGGGGGYVSSSISLSQLPATVTVTVGRSGHLPTYNTNGIESAPATNGGTSSFGSFAIAYGGTSFDNAPTPPRFVQATAAGGSYQGTTGENGGTGDSQSAGGSTTCAGAGGGSGGGAGSSGTSGGSSGCGGNGGGGGFGGGIATDAGDTQGQSGSPGSAPGGGGGGGGNNGGDNGGSGGSGECIITVN